jgi:type VI secretion system protein ImpC
MTGRLTFESGLGRQPDALAPAKRGGPMRLLVLGDFSGRPAAERPPLVERPSHRVDIDSLDAVMGRLAPRIDLSLGVEGTTTLTPRSLDDLHPDALFDTLPLFEALRQSRQQSPAAADQGRLLEGLLGGRPASAAAPPASAAAAVTAAAPGAAPPLGADAALARWLKETLAPHGVPDTRASDAAWQRTVDAAIGAQMRALLHAGAFQSLEAAWRGVQWLVHSLELDESLQLHLFDLSRAELLADVIAAEGQLAQTGLHRALADRWRNVPGAQGWHAVVGLYRFGPSDVDIGLLAALGLVARQAGGPFLAEGDPALAGDAADPALAGWQSLRRSEAAPWIGLAAPRVLLRSPYGKTSDPITAFAFEEFVGRPEHAQLLWGNAGLALALLLGRAYSASGWAFEPGDETTLTALPPCLTTDADGERDLVPSAERFLPEAEAQALLSAGLMPLLSHRHAHAVTLPRMQSIAQPAGSLHGAWQSR